MPNKKLWAIIAATLGVLCITFFIARPKSAPPKGEATTTDHGHEHADEHSDEHGHEEDAGEHGDEHGHNEEIKFEGEAARKAGIVLETVRLTPLAGTIPFNGQIAPNPNSLVRVSSIVPGRVTRLAVAVGDNVRRGQTLAVIESRDIGEAQSAYNQAATRFQAASASLDVVMRQAKAGVFSRGPIEAARRTVVDATSEVRSGETALRAARVQYSNAIRLARAGSFANPAIEAARAQISSATGALKTAQAELDQAEAGVTAAQSELEHRRQQAAAGAYASRPVEEARRVLVSSQSARGAAQSEVATTRANLSRARSLASEGLIARRDQEAAQQAFETANARLETSQADLEAAQAELERQQKLASTNVAGTSEVQAAQSELDRSQAAVRSERAQVQRARDGLRLAQTQLAREERVFRENIANRREVSLAQSTLDAAQNTLSKARQTLSLANATYTREQRIYKQNLNNIAPVQNARAAYLQAQSDLRAARSTLSLFKSSPGGSASIPITAPISGVVQERPVASGEVLASDTVLMTLANLGVVHVDMFIPERDIPLVRVGSPVLVQVDAVPGQKYSGHVELIHSELDPKTRSVEAHVEIPNPGGKLRFGMFARGTIQTGQGTLSLTVPRDAIQNLEGKSVVFVAADEPSTFVAREVVAGATNNGRTVIRSGLKTGDKIVARGAFMVKAQAMKAELGHNH